MLGKIDAEVVEKFKIFQEQSGEYEGLDIETVLFEKVALSSLHEKDKVTTMYTTTSDKFIEIGDINKITKKYNIRSKFKSKLPEKGKHAPKNSILISRVRPLLGGYTIIDGDDYTFTSGDLNPIVLPVEKINIDYAFKIICSPAFKTFLKKNQNTAGQKPTITNELYNFTLPIPKLQGNYSSKKIQEAIIAFLEFWKVEYTDVYRTKIKEMTPFIKTMQEQLIPATFRLDRRLKESFNEFAIEKDFDIKLEEIAFEEKYIYSDDSKERLVDLLNNKRVPITKNKRISGKYPYYGASGISDYVNDYIFDDRLVLLGEDGAKWSSNENSSFIAEGKFWVNNHAHIMKPKLKLLKDTYLVFILNAMDLDKYVTNSTPRKLSQTGLKTIKISIPTHLNYNSIDLQKLLVEFWEMILDNLDERLKLFERVKELCDEIDEAFLYKTFSKIEWGKR